MTAELMCSSTTTSTSITNSIHSDHSYDTNSFLIGIDNHASYSMTNSKKDFISTPTKVNVRIKGIKGHSTSAHRGTVKWTIQDDNGKPHDIILPDTYLIDSLPIRLLSPQHMAQVYQAQDTMTDGTISYTTADSVVLMWNNRKFRRTIRLNPSNVAVLRSAPDYISLMAFTDAHPHTNFEPVGYATNLTPEVDPEDDTSLVTDDAPISSASPPDPPDSTNHPTPSSSPTAPSPTVVRTQGEDQDTNTAESATPNNSSGTESQRQVTFDLDTANMSTSIPIDDDSSHKSTNLPSNSDELLLWHYRLGHKPFAQLQTMAKAGDLPRRLATCKIPSCTACRLGRATKVPWRSKGEENKRQIQVASSPGQCVSMDQMQSTTPGLIGQMSGFITKKRYHFATVFIDHFSRLTFVYAHERITAADTVQAKLAFEAYAKSLGVIIRHYHADNGRFADKEFVLSVKEKQQTISYCGVNAHWQNGIAEKKIRDLQEAARTQIIHAKARWPKAIEPALWPYAIRYSSSISNATINTRTNESPYERFAKVPVKPKLRHMHPFGYPTYVLKDKYQKGGPLPKWESRARVGLYLGPSPRHARSVALVLSLDTGHVSPQYHVRFDDLFETVTDINKIIACKWQNKCHFHRDKDSPSNNSGTTPNPETMSSAENRNNDLIEEQQESSPSDPPGHGSQSQNSESSESEQQTVVENQQQNSSTLLQHPTASTTTISTPRTSTTAQAPSSRRQNNSLATPSTTTTPALTTTTRSGRRVKPTQRMKESIQQRLEGAVAYAAAQVNNEQDQYLIGEVLDYLDDPISAMKATSDPDTMYHHEAMREEDAQQFKEAMVKEVNDHTNRRHWVPVLRTSVPPDIKILPAIWAMKRKRRIATGLIYKWKARLNLGGHKQVVDTETFAPALTWTVIRLFLTLSIIHNWHSRQVDFVLAYPQAEIPRPTFMELPKGINIPGLDRNIHVLQVLRNIYGGKDAGRTWYLHLKKKLESIGFVQSKHDECVFYRGTTIFIVYTDDGIFFDPKKENVDKAINDMAKILNIDDQGNISDYLGVKVDSLNEGGFELTQPQLINSILIELGLINKDGTDIPGTKSVATPALATVLIGPDKDGEPFDYEWKYRTLIGKLNFLEKSTRPDIAYPVHQCARYMANPKQSHGKAIKRIGRYLLRTRNKGYYIKPDSEKGFECYVDASYLGDWDKSIAMDDPATAKSRGAFIVKYAGVPIFWQSKILTQIALSSSEAEYIALSGAARYVLSMMFLMEEINEKITTVITNPTLKCTMFEDNSAAIEIAKVPKIRPRTRHLNVIYHHFREHVAKGRLLIQAIGTDYQDADMLTKQCEQWRFERHRMSIQGW